MRTNAVNVVFFLLALAAGLAMAQLPVRWLEMRKDGRVFLLLAARLRLCRSRRTMTRLFAFT